MAGRRAGRARRSAPRSQHFLRTRELAAELVRDAGIGPADLVLDIGAGHGRLTEQLSRVAGRVVAIEVDAALARALEGRWPNVDVVVADAARTAMPDVPFRVVSNLPFHRTTDLMHVLLDDPTGPLVRADLVVDWNVAVKRAIPWPSSVNGVYWSAFWDIGVARRIHRAAFAPMPSVDAGVLVVRRRSTPLVAPEAAGEYRRFVAAGFRKGARLGSGRGRRLPRDFDAHEWAALFQSRVARRA